MKVILYTDGAARGNPGPAAIGIALFDVRGTEIEAFGETIGRTTNNIAEYRALLRGLERAKAYGADEVEIRTDSELLSRQLTGRYRVRAAHLRALHDSVRSSLTRFKHKDIRHVPREFNRRADELANDALDRDSKR